MRTPDVPVLDAQRRWSCPNCASEEVTYDPRPHTRFHACRGLRGLTAPYVPAGTRAGVKAHEREDYIGSEIVTLDGAGRPIMQVVTERDDGRDVAVFAPCATARLPEDS